ncbi:HAD-IC family P-type ATPase, partial [Candidatus Poribacteria bacterium]|nr:HAD-IC family P-type ATPase [Candidatus Poribacteria bacterium]
VDKRLKEYGPNRLREAKSKSVLLIIIDQFKSLMVLLLAAASCLSFIFGDWVEGIAILAVIIINAGIGFFMEIKAVRSMEALQKLGSVNSKVLRNSEVQEISAEEIVPGDILVLEGGDIVTADLRLFEASKLQADESSLTGESVPVSKDVEALEGEVPLAERKNMLYKGTAITRGSGKGIAVTTGMETELGEISSLVEEAEEERTPLEKRLDKLSHRLIWITLGIAVVIAVAGILSGKEMFLMIETAIALAVAAIPEGLPIVATIALARGMWRMSKRNALIRRLSAVETLGATNVIFTDKTGTLTENRLTVTQIKLDSGQINVSGEGLETSGDFNLNGNSINLEDNQILKELLETGVLCNNASLKEEGEKPVGEPLEVALLIAGAKGGIYHDDLIEELPEENEVAFDSDVKMMATFHKNNGKFRVAVKGAPESILEACSSIRTEDGKTEIQDQDREQWVNKNNEMAEDGLRIIALAAKETDSVEDEPYENLTFLGLAGMLDPPRKDVQSAIEQCHSAGIRAVMVTGDHPATARNVGRAVGLIKEDDDEAIHGSDIKEQEELSEDEKSKLLKSSIFARVSPKQKLDLINAHQENNSVVAMTGDGVNDAPALKKADIGVAMGQRGTQVAQEAADMVLTDDAFSTIVSAVEQGRIIFNNIRKFVLYLLSCNVSEIMAVSIASLINAPLPILPLQILFLNLVTDVFPALALGVGKGDKNIMSQKPRDPKESILTRNHWIAIAGYGFLITISVLVSLFVSLNWLNMGKEQAVTISFLTLAFAQLWHVFNMRDTTSGFFRNDITQNPFIWGALALCCLLLLAAVYIPGFAQILKVVDPGIKGWLLLLSMSFLPWMLGQLSKPLLAHWQK